MKNGISGGVTGKAGEARGVVLRWEMPVHTRGYGEFPGKRSTFRRLAVCHNSSSDIPTAKIERF